MALVSEELQLAVPAVCMLWLSCSSFAFFMDSHSGGEKKKRKAGGKKKTSPQELQPPKVEAVAPGQLQSPPDWVYSRKPLQKARMICGSVRAALNAKRSTATRNVSSVWSSAAGRWRVLMVRRPNRAAVRQTGSKKVVARKYEFRHVLRLAGADTVQLKFTTN